MNVLSLLDGLPDALWRQRQIDVADAIIQTLKDSPIRALMIESHLVAGRQNAPVTYGQSITDACLGFEQTEALLYRLAGAV